jgi:hypothetical protein
MTICVAKPGIVVTDTLYTGSKKRYQQKAFRRNNVIIATAGDSYGAVLQACILHKTTLVDDITIDRLIKFVAENADAFEPCSSLFVTRKEVWCVEGTYVYGSTSYSAAIGSGAAYAVGYLDARPDDLEGAVRSAILHDPCCGGEVETVKFDDD